MATDTSLMTGPERMFYDEMNALEATVEAFIIRKPREWAQDLYGYRVTRKDGSQAAGYLPWDLDTYGTVIAIAKGE